MAWLPEGRAPRLEELVAEEGAAGGAGVRSVAEIEAGKPEIRPGLAN